MTPWVFLRVDTEDGLVGSETLVEEPELEPMPNISS
jgi:hypothetical protein